MRWEGRSLTLVVEPLGDSRFTVLVLADGTGASSKRSSASSAQVNVNDAGSHSLRWWARGRPCCGQFVLMDENMELTDCRTQAAGERLRSWAGYADSVVFGFHCNRHGLPGYTDHLRITGCEIPANSDRRSGHREHANPSDESAEQRMKECPCQCLTSLWRRRSECWLQSW